MKTIHPYNQIVQLSTPKKRTFQNKLLKVKKNFTLHGQENWNDEHILKYRNHLRDVRELQSRWQINDNKKNNNSSFLDSIKSDIMSIQDFQSFSVDQPKKKNLNRPCSSQQKRILYQVRQIQNYPNHSKRQNKMNEFLQHDDNFMNRSFRYYKGFSNYMSQIQ